MAVAFDTPHRRRNPLTGEWVLVSPHRLDRPWQGEDEAPATDPPRAYDPGCYLCPGNTRKNGECNPDYAGVFLFDNDFAALIADDRDGIDEDPLFAAEEGRGACRVLCFSPDHAKTLPELPHAQIRAVVDAWCRESEALGEHYRNVQIFENKGTKMGCSIPQ